MLKIKSQNCTDKKCADKVKTRNASLVVSSMWNDQTFLCWNMYLKMPTTIIKFEKHNISKEKKTLVYNLLYMISVNSMRRGLILLEKQDELWSPTF